MCGRPAVDSHRLKSELAKLDWSAKPPTRLQKTRPSGLFQAFPPASASSACRMSKRWWQSSAPTNP